MRRNRTVLRNCRTHSYFADGEKTAKARLLADLKFYARNEDIRIAATAAAMRRYRQSKKMWNE